ncbi:MAG: histidine phosphatase family protein [Rickettsiales bacterium]|nr:histidine phosphatase family protein [Rickettsiales bacterium]
MKNLYLLRHANTFPSTDNDKDRILTPKGVKEIKSISQQEQLQKSKIDIVLCSTSTRTTQTLHHLEDFLYKNFYTEFKEKLYNPKLEDLLSAVQEIPDHFSDLMVISHNPAISDIANYLLQDSNISLGTAHIINIALDIDSWLKIRETHSILKWTIKPVTL